MRTGWDSKYLVLGAEEGVDAVRFVLRWTLRGSGKALRGRVTAKGLEWRD
ncbi:MAG: hypothetical protein ABR971_09760 [Acidobacteriaceae bacterium]